MRSIFGFLIACSLSVSVAAEGVGSEQPSPEDDLDCALFLAHVLGKNYEHMSEEERRGFASAHMYFVGRYEAARGTGIGPALAERDALIRGTNLDPLAEECGLRLEAMKLRVSEYAKLVDTARPSNDDPANEVPLEAD